MELKLEKLAATVNMSHPREEQLINQLYHLQTYNFKSEGKSWNMGLQPQGLKLGLPLQSANLSPLPAMRQVEVHDGTKAGSSSFLSVPAVHMKVIVWQSNLTHTEHHRLPVLRGV